mmetsp:Transcript_114549/g.262855  ORF Transcript_114549/g.262855 Transcript_114549/m.262855 type:complete len:93 (+) Transcript_114549:46-324(+)
MSKASGACPLGECCSEHLSSDINKVPFFWLKTGLVLAELHGLGPQETMNEYKKIFWNQHECTTGFELRRRSCKSASREEVSYGKLSRFLTGK